MGKPKSNTSKEPMLTYVPPQDDKYYVYRSRMFLLNPIPYVWELDLKSIDKIKSLL